MTKSILSDWLIDEHISNSFRSLLRKRLMALSLLPLLPLIAARIVHVRRSRSSAKHSPLGGDHLGKPTNACEDPSPPPTPAGNHSRPSRHSTCVLRDPGKPAHSICTSLWKQKTRKERRQNTLMCTTFFSFHPRHYSPPNYLSNQSIVTPSHATTSPIVFDPIPFLSIIESSACR